MIRSADDNPTVVRTSRGLSIAGTRITLYALMDYFRAGWSPKLVQQWFGLTETQMEDVVRYLDAHCEQVDEEYQKVLKRSEENRRYWEERQQQSQLRKTTEGAANGDSLRDKLMAWKQKVSSP
jgi:uncharacterized protein (DUF433 family)